MANDDSTASMASSVDVTLRRSSHNSVHDAAMQSLFKELLRARIFRGYYVERRYVEALEGYRDAVLLQRSELELQKLLLHIGKTLNIFYQHNPSVTPIWLGITHGETSPTMHGALETCIWTELNDMAFGQYWFTIKTVRFRADEIIVKMKMLRCYEPEARETSSSRLRLGSITHVPAVSKDAGNAAAVITNAPTSECTQTAEPQIGLQDFVKIVEQWGESIKKSAYDFLSKDISKDNLKGLIQFLGLVVISLLTATAAGIKFLGIFTLRFMFELSRFTHVLTPVIIKCIDVFSKIVGGFYILLTMLWRDTIGHRLRPNNMPAVAYNRPVYKSIKYNLPESQSENVNEKNL